MVNSKQKLLISFSGGETSAFMGQWLIANKANQYDDLLCLFANTGQENEQTLDFVEQCDKRFRLNVVWVEANVQEGRVGTSHKIVDYKSASRHGEPFEAVIKKYGIPNQAYPHCTRELKLAPIRSYLRSIGWSAGDYDTAIGIRCDEIDRMSPDAKQNRLIYPLVTDCPMTKPQINKWWSRQPFRLQLKGYEGNCKWCWKKSMRKHLTLINEHPDWYDFPERMENKYGLAGYNVDGTKRVFFRNNQSTKDLRLMAKTMDFVPASDDAQEYVYQQSLDLGAGCTESCEIDFGEL